MVVAGVLQRLLHLLDRQGTEGVSNLGTVYGDPGDPLRLVVPDVFELSGFLPNYAGHAKDYRDSRRSCSKARYASGASKRTLCPAPGTTAVRTRGLRAAMRDEMLAYFSSRIPAT